MKSILTATLSGILIADNPATFVSRRVPNIAAILEGFPGDRHAGFTRLSDGRHPQYPRGTVMHNARQLSIVSEEELAITAEAMGIPHILPEWLGANLLIRGAPDLTHLPPTSTMRFPDEAVIVIYKENKPCRGPGRVIQSHYPDVPGLAEAFPKYANHLRGLLAWVERPGNLREGDAVTIDVADQVIY